MESILITGGSGYLGQFLVHALSKNYRVYYTYSSRPLPEIEGTHGLKVDLVTGDGLAEALRHASEVIAVINCAAVSSPALCEGENKAYARALNIPNTLISHLKKLNSSPLLIHMSSDQVYEGYRSMWSEDDDCQPVNAYGQSKVDAEREIRASYDNHCILRSSIIYGPAPPLLPLPSERFLQFIERSLSKGSSSPATFFRDEWRSVVWVEDIIRVVRALLERMQMVEVSSVTYNLGGPLRISRLEFAETVADVWGLAKELIVSASCNDASRSIKSPQDISMDVSKIEKDLCIRMTPLRDALVSMDGNRSNI